MQILFTCCQVYGQKIHVHLNLFQKCYKNEVKKNENVIFYCIRIFLFKFFRLGNIQIFKDNQARRNSNGAKVFIAPQTR